MSEIHALSGAYAIDALDDGEREQFDQHLATCAECRAEVVSFRDTSALLAEIDAEQPPSAMRGRILADISRVRPLPPAPRHISTARRLTRRWVTTSIAAAVAVIALVGGVVFLTGSNGSGNSQLADQVLNAQDAVSATREVPGGGTITLVRSASLKRAVMVARNVPEPASGKVYQLWLRQPGVGMVSAGLMPDTHVTTVLAGDAATATLAAVSVEPDTGSPQPTSPPIATFPLRAT